VPHYDKIQDAVDAVPAGGVVGVCAGRWAEQVRITKSLTLTGLQSGNEGLAVIVTPAGGLVQNASSLFSDGFLAGGAPIAAQILVTGGVTAHISKLALDATGGVTACSGPPFRALKPVGIYFQHASGSVTRVAARNQVNHCGFGGRPQGDGVLVQNATAPSPTVTVRNSSFDSIGWMAVHASANTAGAKVTVDGNTVVGIGVTNGNAIYFSLAPPVR
jgi:hypothetical protein